MIQRTQEVFGRTLSLAIGIIAIWAFNMPSGSRGAAEIGMSGSSGTVLPA
jgi:hypothetical protein